MDKRFPGLYADNIPSLQGKLPFLNIKKSYFYSVSMLTHRKFYI